MILTTPYMSTLLLQVRNKMMVSLLQQLRRVHQLQAADILTQFQGVILMGSFNYGCVGSPDHVAEMVRHIPFVQLSDMMSGMGNNPTKS